MRSGVQLDSGSFSIRAKPSAISKNVQLRITRTTQRGIWLRSMTNDEARKNDEAPILPERAGDNSASVIRALALITHSGFVIPHLTALTAAKGFTYLERTYILQAL